MVGVTVLALVDIALRVFAYPNDAYTGVVVLVVSLVTVTLLTAGAALGGLLVYEYGFNVETAGDSPVWHHSERDILPGRSEPSKLQEAEPDARRGAA
jgi:hypothetical protein